MNKMKKGIMMLLIMALLIALAAACNRSSGNDGDSGGAAPQPTSAPAASDSGTTDAGTTDTGTTDTGTEDPVDTGTENLAAFTELDGYEFVFKSNWYGDYVGTAEEFSEYNEAFLDRLEDLEAKYNMTINFEHHPAYEIVTEVTLAAAAGDKFCDFFDVLSWEFYRMANNGLLQDLNLLSNYNPNNRTWDSGITRSGNIRGGQYGIANGHHPNRNVFFVNQSMLERLNLEPIENLIDRDEWNWDKLREYAIAGTIRGSDGTYESYGIAGITDTLPIALVTSNHGQAVIEQDGRYVFNGLSPNSIEALEFFRDLIHTHQVVALQGDDPNWYAMGELFTDGKLLMFSYDDWILEWGGLPDMEDNFIIVPFPKGPQANDYTAFFAQFRIIGMPAGNPLANEIMGLMDELFYPIPGHDLQDKLDREARLLLRDDRSAHWRAYIDTLASVDLASISEVQQFWFNEGVTAVINNEMTPVAAMETIRDLAQAQLDEFWEQ